MTNPGLENIDAVYQYLTSDVTGAAEKVSRRAELPDRKPLIPCTWKKCCLQERALELLPRLVDQLCLPGIASPSSQLHAQSSHVLHYLLDNASPKELSLTLETELERAIDEIAECFFVDEDSSTTEEQQDEDQQKSQGQTHTKTLQFVSKRICVALDSHRCGKLPHSIKLDMKLTRHVFCSIGPLGFQDEQSGHPRHSGLSSTSRRLPGGPDAGDQRRRGTTTLQQQRSLHSGSRLVSACIYVDKQVDVCAGRIGLVAGEVS